MFYIGQLWIRELTMTFNRDGMRVATCVFEAACFHKSVEVRCRCGHACYFQAHGLWWLFHRKRWSDEFRDMPERFYCARCHMTGGEKVRPIHIGASERQFQKALPMPDDREWKRALRRFRS